MILEYLRNSKFLKSISILITGSLLAQIITVITAPIMTRLFSVEDIGIYTYITTIAYLFLTIINGRYDLAIVSEKMDKNVYPLIKLCLIVSAVLISIITVGTFFYLYNFTDYCKYIIFIILLLFVNAYINIVSAYNNRIGDYTLLSKVNVIRALATCCFIILFGLLEFGAFGLLIATIIGQLFCLNKQAQGLKKNIKNIFKVNIIKCLILAKKYKGFICFSAPAAFFNSFSYSTLNFFIESLYGLVTLGFYSISFRILGMPLSLISSNISKVFFEKASKDYNTKGNFTNIFLKTTFLLSFLALPIVIVIYYFSPVLCEIFFGKEWIVAGEYVQILIVMFGIRFVVSPLSVGVLITKDNIIEIIIQSLFLISIFSVYYFSYITNSGIKVFLNYYAISNSIIYILWWLAILFLSNRSKKWFK